ncbi:hypothetical protein Cfor_00738 [Coptotermes formosanus]|uniref:Amine oxidase n=1 Tax=Coptotermes formosanus TaxID=36987 RepID=A0A6L2Q3Z9_COPFO|nr:hypothetical protein Cfor_00738 [Coptotermes formosanus]
MAIQVPADRPWRAPHATEWDQITVKEFLNKNCWTRDAREFLEAMSVGNNCAEDHQMSLLFFLWYLRQSGGVDRIWSIKGGAQERKIVGGSQQISVKIAEKLGDRIHLKKAVVQIRQLDDGVTVKTLDGTDFSGSYVVLAIPPPAHVSSDIKFTGSADLYKYICAQKRPVVGAYSVDSQRNWALFTYPD